MNNDASQYHSIAFVDLDGTLMKGNTWHFFARMMLRKALRKCRPLLFIRLNHRLWLRKRRRIAHADVKQFFARHSSRLLSEDEFKEFAKEMATHFNPEVLKLIEEARNAGALIVLATAAAGEYAPYVAKEADIRECICTPPAQQGKEYVECRGEIKADEAQALASRYGLPVSLVVTDHPDDMPLFRRFPEARHVLIK